MVRDEGGIYLFCGQEDFLKEEALRGIVSNLLPDKSKELNCDTYNAKDDYKDIFDAINTLPLFPGKKVVIIKEIENLPEPKREYFLKYLKDPPNNIYLILQSNKTALSDEFIKIISHYTRIYLFKKLKVPEVRNWIYKRLNQYKKTITTDALDLLLELKGSQNMALLSKELEKLVTYKGEDKTITKEDVIELVGKSVTKGVFDLIEAISFKDRDSALLLMHELADENKNKIPEMLGLMGWQLKRIFRAKALLARGKNKYRLADELKIGSFSIDKFLSQVKCFNIEQLKRDFKLLLEADHSIKTGRHKPKFILEQLIMELCRA